MDQMTKMEQPRAVATKAIPQPAAEPKCFDAAQLASIENAVREGCGPATAAKVHAMLSAAPVAVPAAKHRPTDDELWDQTLRERDSYHDIADRLANGIAECLGIDIGEHSSGNCPWENAIEALEDADDRKMLEDRKDAERYRWLREFGFGLPKRLEELDATIDAALAANKEVA